MVAPPGPLAVRNLQDLQKDILMQAAIQNLADRLHQCVDSERNVTDMESALEVVNALEKENLITKEVLEVSTGSRSGSSSRNGTPVSQVGLSPAIRRRLTPGLTPRTHLVSPLVTSDIRSKSTTPSGRTVTPGRVTSGGRLVEVNLTPVQGSDTCIPNGSTENGSWRLTNSYAPTGTVPDDSKSTVSALKVSPKLTKNSPNSSNVSPAVPGGGIKLRIKFGGGVGGQPLSTMVRTVSSPSMHVPSKTDFAEATLPVSSSCVSISNSSKIISNSTSPPFSLSPVPEIKVCDSMRSKEIDQSRIAAGLSPRMSPKVSPTINVQQHPGSSRVSPNSTPSLCNGMDKGSSAAVDDQATPNTVSQPKKRGRKRKEEVLAEAAVNVIPKLPGKPPKLKSTAELVAQMTATLPENMSISIEGTRDLSSPSREDEERKVPNYLRDYDTSDYYGDANDEDSQDKKKKLKKLPKNPTSPEDMNAAKRKHLENFLEDSIDSAAAKKDRSSFSPIHPPKRGRGRPRKYVKLSHSPNPFITFVDPETPSQRAVIRSQNVLAADKVSVNKSPDVPNTNPAESSKSCTKSTDIPNTSKQGSPNWYGDLPPLNPLLVRSIRLAGKIVEAEEAIAAEEEELLDNSFEGRGTEDVDAKATAPSDPSLQASSSDFVHLSPSHLGHSDKSGEAEDYNNSDINRVPDLRNRFETVDRERVVLGMPYLDIGIPDFLEYKYPDRQNYLSEFNFIHRPPDTIGL